MSKSSTDKANQAKAKTRANKPADKTDEVKKDAAEAMKATRTKPKGFWARLFGK